MSQAMRCSQHPRWTHPSKKHVSASSRRIRTRSPWDASRDRNLRYLTVVTHFRDGTTKNLHLLGTGPARYVALGDSFSSGEGYPAFEPGSDTEDGSNNCHRSLGSYSRQLSQDFSLRRAFIPATFAACSGAITDDYLHNNAKNSDEGPQASEVSQFTDRVTLTMGGNDVGFGGMVLACTVLDDCGGIPPGDAGAWYSPESITAGVERLEQTLDCLSPSKKGLLACLIIKEVIRSQAYKGTEDADFRSERVDNLGPDSTSRLSSRLNDLYSSLLRDAPNAQVFVGNYPDAVDASASSC